MFEENWSLIRGEAEKQLVSKFSRFLPDEEENLRETGEVKQMIWDGIKPIIEEWVGHRVRENKF